MATEALLLLLLASARAASLPRCHGVGTALARTPVLARTPAPRAALADARYRKSTNLYEQLEAGRASASAAPVSRPVLLAPAGGWPQVEAAIKAGADAIYFGCAAGLNARARATNFGEEELPELMERLHAAGLEGYMCVNMLDLT
jgi:putative protease